MKVIRGLYLSLLLALSAGSAPAADMIPRAEDFMQAYARELSLGDRQAVANRYARRGAILVRSGRREVRSFEEVVARYATRWRPPVAFRWQQLAYEAVGEQAVLVTGEFVWESQGAMPPRIVGYVGLLVLEDGELRIRLEDETPQSPPVAN